MKARAAEMKPRLDLLSGGVGGTFYRQEDLTQKGS